MKKIDINAIDECVIRLKMLCNNLTLVRLGLANKEIVINPEVIDNALYIVEEEIERLADEIEELI